MGILEDVERKDRKGWRLFTEDDVNKIKFEATRLSGGGRLLEETTKGAS